MACLSKAVLSRAELELFSPRPLQAVESGRPGRTLVNVLGWAGGAVAPGLHAKEDLLEASHDARHAALRGSQRGLRHTGHRLSRRSNCQACHPHEAWLGPHKRSTPRGYRRSCAQTHAGQVRTTRTHGMQRGSRHKARSHTVTAGSSTRKRCRASSVSAACPRFSVVSTLCFAMRRAAFLSSVTKCGVQGPAFARRCSMIFPLRALSCHNLLASCVFPSAISVTPRL